MNYYDDVDLLAALCKATGKWGLFLRFPDYLWDEMLDKGLNTYIEECWKAVPWLNDDNPSDPENPLYSVPFMGTAYFLFDSEKEMEEKYEMVRGDDPNDINLYVGPVRVYALTFGPDGEGINENS